MKSGQELYDEHRNRLKDAIAMKKTDRPPLLLNAGAFAILYAGGKLSDLCLTPEHGNDLILKGILAMGDGEVDCLERIGDYPPTMSPFVKVPGRELQENGIWQIDERGLMTVEDYDTVIEKGWSNFNMEYLQRIGSRQMEEMKFFMPMVPDIVKKFNEAGVLSMTEGYGSGAGFGALCGARGIENFMKDLHRIPEKVLAASEVIANEGLERTRQHIRDNKPFTLFTGGSREAGDFISMKVFDKFVWPYFKRGVELIAEEGSYAYMHLDLSWDRFIGHFLELPKGKCIFSSDGSTDIFEAHEKLAGHMCFTGDIAPSLMTLGTADEVHAYCERMIDQFASQGFIMSTGCMLPANSRVENVKAMMAATLGK